MRLKNARKACPGFVQVVVVLTCTLLGTAASDTFESGRWVNGEWMDSDGWVNSGLVSNTGYWTWSGSGVSRDGTTPSGSTGAAKAQGGSNFMYLEASSGTSSSPSTLTRTVPAGTAAVSWYFHMFGESMGTLRLEAFTAAGSWKSVWSKTGQQHAQQAAAYTAAKARRAQTYFLQTNNTHRTAALVRGTTVRRPPPQLVEESTAKLG